MCRARAAFVLPHCDGGRARIYSETSGFALRDGRTAELDCRRLDAGDWECCRLPTPLIPGTMVADRERYLAQRLRYDSSLRQLRLGWRRSDAYGDWAYTNDYGWIWRPHVTVVNNYINWAPYRYGNWAWISPYGWTWVGYEPWGWAPYHYGRWVYYNNYWAWCPRSQYYRNRSWWRPALVAFNISFGNHVSWYPLSYHHRDPRSRRYDIQTEKYGWRNPRFNEIAYLRAVTTSDAGDFGGDGVRFKGVNEVTARRILGEEPLKGDLPLRPANVYQQKGTGQENANARITMAKPRVQPATDIVVRPTGAAIRKTGAPLDAELRHSRVFGGRESKSISPQPKVGDDLNESRSTGAVTRPPKTVDIEPGDNSGTIQRGDKGLPRVPRTDANDGTGVIKRDQDYKGRPARTDSDPVVAPVKPKIDDDDSHPAKTVRPQPRERTETPRYDPRCVSTTRHQSPSPRRVTTRRSVRNRCANTSHHHNELIRRPNPHRRRNLIHRRRNQNRRRWKRHVLRRSNHELLVLRVGEQKLATDLRGLHRVKAFLFCE